MHTGGRSPVTVTVIVTVTVAVTVIVTVTATGTVTATVTVTPCARFKICLVLSKPQAPILFFKISA